MKYSKEEWIELHVRPKRDKLLNDVDVVHCNAEKWELMDEVRKEEWRVYKQALRDITDVIEFDEGQWPVMPSND